MFLPKALTFLNAVDSSLKLLSLILTGIIFWKAYTLYRLYSEEQLRYFTLGFLFFAISHFISFLVDMIIYSGIIAGGILGQVVFTHDVVLVFLSLRFGTMLFAFLFLLMIALGFPNRKVQLAIILLTIIAGYLSSFKSLYFHVVVTLFTLFILIDLYAKYKRTQRKALFLYLLGMLSLYLAYLSYLFFLKFAFFYWLGHGLEILSSILFIASLISIFSKNETKTRKARHHT